MSKHEIIKNAMCVNANAKKKHRPDNNKDRRAKSKAKTHFIISLFIILKNKNNKNPKGLFDRYF